MAFGSALSFQPRSELCFCTSLRLICVRKVKFTKVPLNPYMSVIKQVHEDVWLPRQALGHWCTLLHNGHGFREEEGYDFE